MNIYCAQDEHFHSDGSPYYTPVPNLQVTSYETVTATTGWHSHSAPGRPDATLVGISNPTSTPGVGVTGQDGCVTFTYHGPSYSGWHTFEFFPATGAYGTLGENNYLGYSGPSVAGQPLYYLIPIPSVAAARMAPFSLHNDRRHEDTFGAFGYSRYGTPNSVRAISTIALVWTFTAGGPLEQRRTSGEEVRNAFRLRVCLPVCNKHMFIGQGVRQTDVFGTAQGPSSSNDFDILFSAGPPLLQRSPGGKWSSSAHWPAIRRSALPAQKVGSPQACDLGSEAIPRDLTSGTPQRHAQVSSRAPA